MVETVVVESISTGGLAAIGAGLAIGLSALGAAWSQSSIGAAALGAVAERPELEKNVLIYMVLPEILALLGFAIAFLLVGQVGGKTE